MRVLYGLQCRLRTDPDQITPAMIIKEVNRLGRQAEHWIRHKPCTAVVKVVFLALGPAIHKHVKTVMGKVLQPGSSIWGKTVPKQVHLIVPTDEQLAELLGKDCLESFTSFRIPHKGVSASDVEALASALAQQPESDSEV
jgi:hypothetical protein